MVRLPRFTCYERLCPQNLSLNRSEAKYPTAMRSSKAHALSPEKGAVGELEHPALFDELPPGASATTKPSFEARNGFESSGVEDMTSPVALPPSG